MTADTKVHCAPVLVSVNDVEELYIMSTNVSGYQQMAIDHINQSEVVTSTGGTSIAVETTDQLAWHSTPSEQQTDDKTELFAVHSHGRQPEGPLNRRKSGGAVVFCFGELLLMPVPVLVRVAQAAPDWWTSQDLVGML